MNSPFHPLLLLSLLISAGMLAVGLRARRRRIETDLGPVQEWAATAPAHLPEHVRHPPPIAPATSGWHLRGLESPHADPGTDGAVGRPPMPPLDAGCRRTLTDMLEGIRLPYDMLPITAVVEDVDRHIVFLTTYPNAAEVGKRFADELERLGFEFEAVAFDQAVAVRGGDVVSMKIVPDADRVEVAGSPRYGTAGPGDVALETWIGRSPAPPSTPGGGA